jgi:hypothetical protein
MIVALFDTRVHRAFNMPPKIHLPGWSIFSADTWIDRSGPCPAFLSRQFIKEVNPAHSPLAQALSLPALPSTPSTPARIEAVAGHLETRAFADFGRRRP